MAKIHLIFFTLVFCLWQMTTSAQTDSVRALPAVEVVGENLRSNGTAERTENWDTETLQDFRHGNIGEILEQQSGVFVKNYGPGTLATLSTRGSSAGHTAVTWNGLPIQSPMLGLLDLSLLPSDFADEVSLRLGGNSSLWGSGAIGGVLNLENKAVLEQPFQIGFGSAIGSFGRLDHRANLEWGNEKFGTSTTLLRNAADNDFTYKIGSGKTEKTLTHAARAQHAVLQEFYWKIRPNQKLALHAWWQNTSREIPPTTVQSRSEATQDDKVRRLALHWERAGEVSVWKARLGFFCEEIDYRDPLIGLAALSHFWSLIGDVEGQFQWGEKQKLSVGFTQMLTRAFADEYGSARTESQSALFASLQHYFGKTKSQLSVRQSLVDGKALGFTPALAIWHPLSGRLALRAKISRDYRLPTLNDRHWRPGGNADLKPEHGWGQEIGWMATWPFGGSQIKYEATFFNRNTSNWIQWSPSDEGSFWSAQNLSKVWSRGIEQRLGVSFGLPKAKWTFTVGHDFVRSTNEVALEIPKIGAGEQLIYMPKHQAFSGLKFKTKAFSISYRHRMVSNFTAPNGSLDEHHLGYFRSGWHFAKQKFGGDIFFQIDNVWAEGYRVVERRPMPGRSFSAGANFKFTTK